MSSDNAKTMSNIGHYENFPVASVLCPPHLRAPVMAIYHFARTADDIADEDMRRLPSGSNNSPHSKQRF